VVSGSEVTPRAARSVLDLGPRARVVFAGVYTLVMLTVIVSAQFRPDHVFGFQMFNESSTVNIHLFRRVRGRRALEPLGDGTFTERAHGVTRTFSWLERVHDPVLSKLDTPTHAKYGLEGQLFRLQLALDDFVARLSKDSETLGLVAVVETLKNGRDPRVLRLKADRR
jgi:hypothetical protein